MSFSQQQQMKRKNENESSAHHQKRANTTSTTTIPMDDDMMEGDFIIPDRPSTPPLGMTLSHYNPATGGYTSSQLNSNSEVKSSICTGMTPVYRAPFERWGSCLI
ncbi:unnamed protein product [Mucor hiemalis]